MLCILYFNVPVHEFVCKCICMCCADCTAEHSTDWCTHKSMFENISQLALACTHGAHKCKPIYVYYVETSILKFAHTNTVRPNTLEIFPHRTHEVVVVYLVLFSSHFRFGLRLLILIISGDEEASRENKCQN